MKRKRPNERPSSGLMAPIAILKTVAGMIIYQHRAKNAKGYTHVWYTRGYSKQHYKSLVDAVAGKKKPQ